MSYGAVCLGTLYWSHSVLMGHIEIMNCVGVWCKRAALQHRIRSIDGIWPHYMTTESQTGPPGVGPKQIYVPYKVKLSTLM